MTENQIKEAAVMDMKLVAATSLFKVSHKMVGGWPDLAV